ncbi:hypothetical protein OE88DRAFT_1663595 [Heliocybe sulcata]|uniref:Small ribosomal subunit protein uS5m n=1 Tax=Heliocybe sulcata TaxID=5364 RepID=A0A5C3MW39_9AGAM|nr:hypothetical protein OE88DRAFT_1663595 [Heliocybe sulcata]
MQRLAQLCKAGLRQSRPSCKASPSSSCSKYVRAYSTPSPPTTSPESQDGSTQPASAEPEEDDALEDPEEYPNLLTYHPYYDSFQAEELEPLRAKHKSRVIIRNDSSMFLESMNRELEDVDDDERVDVQKQQGKEDVDWKITMSISKEEINRLHQYLLVTRRVTQQTGKGRIQRMQCLVVVGNGNGLVGYGEGKAEEVPEAQEQALKEAVRNMDFVERFEERTIFTEMNSKFGATQIILRPRPVGFGLACQSQIHQVLKAAGIKDCSAKVWGSRNKMNVIKTLFRMLHSGNAPLGMGNGFGGGARRLDKGSGVRSSRDVERERGRRLVPLRTW